MFHIEMAEAPMPLTHTFSIKRAVQALVVVMRLHADIPHHSAQHVASTRMWMQQESVSHLRPCRAARRGGPNGQLKGCWAGSKRRGPFCVYVSATASLATTTRASVGQRIVLLLHGCRDVHMRKATAAGCGVHIS